MIHNIRIPTDGAIRALYTRYQTPLHIQLHQRVVATCAVVLGTAMNDSKGRSEPRVNLPLVRSAGFLHDIGKIMQLEPSLFPLVHPFIKDGDKPHHAIYGLRILEYEGYPVVASLVNLHIGSMYAREPEKFTTIESKIMMLSDMRVIEDRVVSMHDRIHYIEDHYGLVFGTSRDSLKELEMDMFDLAGFPPDSLLERVNIHGLETLSS